MDGDGSLVMPRLSEQRCNGLAHSMEPFDIQGVEIAVSENIARL